MSARYLQVSYRNGRPMAAYFYLPRQPGDRTARTRRMQHGLVIDFTNDGRPIGVEITSPRTTTLAHLNEALLAESLPPATLEEVSPLLAAS